MRFVILIVLNKKHNNLLKLLSRLKEGYLEYYNIMYKCNYISDKKEVYWEWYHSNGNVKIQEIYI